MALGKELPDADVEKTMRKQLNTRFVIYRAFASPNPLYDRHEEGY